MSPNDSNDLGFSPTSITNTADWDYMHIPAGAAKLYINMQDTDDAYKLYLTNQADINIDVPMGAISQYFVSTAAVVGAIMLQSMF